MKDEHESVRLFFHYVTEYELHRSMSVIDLLFYLNCYDMICLHKFELYTAKLGFVEL